MAVPPTLPLDVERTGCTPLHCHSTSSVPKRCAQARVAVPLARNRTLRAEWQCELGRPFHESGLFGGSCGLTPRRRCQPSSGATHAESVFSTKREGPASRRSRHAVVTEALVPLGAARVAYSYRDSRRNSVHKCPKTTPRGHFRRSVYTIAIPRPPTTQAHVATVYTNAPKQPREAILANLCTLLRRRPGGEAHVAGVVTQPPTHTNSRSL